MPKYKDEPGRGITTTTTRAGQGCVVAILMLTIKGASIFCLLKATNII